MRKSIKTLFITGGATGIGRSVARLFYQNGYNVSIVDIDEEMVRQTIEGWSDDRFLFHSSNVIDSSAMKQAVSDTLAKFDKIDTVVLNAGMHLSNTILTVTEQQLDDIINVNIKGYVNTIRAVLPQMIEDGGGSIVVNVSDQAFIGKRNNFSYGLTKGAIGQMIKSIALDYAEDNITISGVCAGTIDTPLSRRALQRWADNEFEGDYDKALELESASIPVQRLGDSKEVAEFFYFLSNARYVTGSLHLIDGGLVAG